MKDIIYKFLLTVSLIVFSLSFMQNNKIHNFDSNAVKDNVKYLSSAEFDGRIAGSIGNIEAGSYIKNQFVKSGLLPYKSNYYQAFQTECPEKINADPYLKVFDKDGKLLKEYKYNVDYKEDMLNFRSNKFNFSAKDFPQFKDVTITFKSGSSSYALYTPSSNDLSFRSSFISTSSFDMYIIVESSVMEELKKDILNYDSISCYIPMQVKKSTVNNVAGYIKGKYSTLPPLILSSHFDHLGSDFSGNIYSGALDNASGISFVMEMSKYIKSLGTPDRDIIFLGFNAEEFGCLGSKAFAESNKNSLQGSTVLNFDMIGSSNDIPLSIMGGASDTKNTSLIKAVAAICNVDKVNYNYLFQDASDHEYFRKEGVNAITFCDDDVSRIHTPRDTYQYINRENIDRCFKVASAEVIATAFDNNIMILNYKKVLLPSLVCVIIFSVVVINSSKKKNIKKDTIHFF